MKTETTERLKFRGLCISGKAWYYGLVAIPQVTVGAVRPGVYISNSKGMPFAYQVRPETVGQWTGLKDKNGVEVYEGDILSVIDPNDEKVEDWIVEYQDSSTCFPIEVSMDDFDVTTLGWAKCFGFILEVIGNIHEVAAKNET